MYSLIVSPHTCEIFYLSLTIKDTPGQCQCFFKDSLTPKTLKILKLSEQVERLKQKILEGPSDLSLVVNRLNQRDLPKRGSIGLLKKTLSPKLKQELLLNELHFH